MKTKLAKAFLILAVALALSRFITIASEYIGDEWRIIKRQIASRVIEEDLSGKDLTIDIKSKTAKPLAQLSNEDLRKALWVLKVQNEQLADQIATVKSAIDYHGGVK